MREFVMGDIHGEVEKLKDCLKKVDFNYEKDKLIQLGDVVDRGEWSYETVEELLKIKNRISLRGNHDEMWMETLCFGRFNPLWSEGGKETFHSYEKYYENFPDEAPASHQQFFLNQLLFYINENNDLFVHGGINRHEKIEKQSKKVLLWDRDFWSGALSCESMKDKSSEYKMRGNFKRVFLGHTPTILWGINKPMKAKNVWNLDTGCGKGNNPLTIMNVETEEYFQSFE